MKARILIYGASGAGKSIVAMQISERAELAGFTVDVRRPICEDFHPLPSDPIENQFCDISIQEITNEDDLKVRIVLQLEMGFELQVKISLNHMKEDLDLLFEIIQKAGEI